MIWTLFMERFFYHRDWKPVTRVRMPWSRREIQPQGPIDPTAMIPVTAADVARRKRRIAIACLAAGAAVVFGAVWIHQRSTAPLKAQAAFEAGRGLMTAARYNQAILNFDGAIAARLP
jgi:hypothetical protein